MSKRVFDVVVLGGGVAAGYVAQRFVQRGIPAGKTIAIVGQDAELPYERPALSKGFFTAKARLPGFHTCVGAGWERQDAAWYEKHGIACLLDVEVTGFDPSSRTLRTADGDEIGYSTLIAATGCHALAPADIGIKGAEGIEGIYCLRSYQDALRLWDAVQAHAGEEVVVVGGGYIGMELAAALAANNVHVTMLFGPFNYFMPRLFTEELSKFYEDYYERKGIKLCKAVAVQSFLSEGGHITGAVLTNGEKVSSRMMVLGVGSKPRTELFEGKLDMDKRGVKVDARFRTSVPNVYAVGDIATFPLKVFANRPERLEHVSHARASAACAVDDILGSGSDYDFCPYFYSRVFDLNWKFYGDSTGGQSYVIRDDKRVMAYWIKDGTVMGIFLESGTDDEFKRIQAAAIARTPIDPSVLAGIKTVDQGLALISA